jgi:hypothetical protein
LDITNEKAEKQLQRHRDIGYLDFVHCPDFAKIIMKKHNVSETASVSVLR